MYCTSILMRTFLIFIIAQLYATFINAQWQSKNLDSIPITSLNATDSRIFAGTQGGVYISGDFGNTWIYRPVSHTYSLYAMAANGNTLFAGISNGLRISTDNGSTWSAVNALINFPVHDVMVHGGNIFTASQLGVHISANNGAQWTLVNNGLPQLSDTKKLAGSGGDIFAVADSTIYISGNNGAQWSLADSGLNSNKVYALTINGSYMFAGTNHGVYVSTNHGGIWSAANNGLPDTAVRAIAASGTSIYAATDNGIYYSGDNGGTWTSIHANLPAGKVSGVAVSGTNLFVSLADMVPSGELWSRSLLQTGQNENIYSSNLLLYPNPASGKLYMAGDASKIRQAVFYNGAGTAVVVPIQNGVFDLSGFAKGVYIIRLYDGEKSYSEKIMIQ